jgi:hypothetical protein
VDVVRDLSDPLPIDPPDGDERGLFTHDFHVGGDRVQFGLGISQAQLELVLVNSGFVADADDFQLFLKPGGDADNGVLGQGPAEPVEHFSLLGVVGPDEGEVRPFEARRDPLAERGRKLAFLSLDFDPIGKDRGLDARGQDDRSFAYA